MKWKESILFNALMSNLNYIQKNKREPTDVYVMDLKNVDISFMEIEGAIEGSHYQPQKESCIHSNQKNN